MSKLYKPSKKQLNTMGRIKSRLIKRASNLLIKTHGESFNENFEENKKAIPRFLETNYKKLKNPIAGYITRMIRKKNAEEKSFKAEKI